MRQLTIDDIPEIPEARARNSDPQTSHDAATSVDVSRLQRICLEAIRGAVDGLTSEQLATVTGLPLVTVSPRLRPLAENNLIYAGERRKNRSGRTAIVWRPVMGIAETERKLT